MNRTKTLIVAALIVNLTVLFMIVNSNITSLSGISYLQCDYNHNNYVLTSQKML